MWNILFIFLFVSKRFNNPRLFRLKINPKRLFWGNKNSPIPFHEDVSQ